MKERTWDLKEVTFKNSKSNTIRRKFFWQAQSYNRRCFQLYKKIKKLENKCTNNNSSKTADCNIINLKTDKEAIAKDLMNFFYAELLNAKHNKLQSYWKCALSKLMS